MKRSLLALGIGLTGGYFLGVIDAFWYHARGRR